MHQGAAVTAHPPGEDGRYTWRLELSWLGTAFAGWQRQPDCRTVQAAVEDAARQVLGGEEVRVRASGRTDAGVHAAQQFVALRCHARRTAAAMRDGLNHHLPDDVVCLDAAPAPADFDPRRWTRAKTYRYRFLVRRARCPFRRDLVWHWGSQLDAAVMHRAGQQLVGRHDFSSFRATGCSAHHPVRTLDAVTARCVDDEVHVDFVGNGFLRHQVRIMAGTLCDVGRGAWTDADVAAALAARRRDAAGQTAPAAGLWLMSVELGHGPRAG